MTPYYERSGITIYHGDCLDVLPALKRRWRVHERLVREALVVA